MRKYQRFMIRFKEFCRLSIEAVKNCSGEGQIGLIGEELTRNLREKVIGKTVYRIRSVFEGKKDIDKTLERLAVKNIEHSDGTRDKDASA